MIPKGKSKYSSDVSNVDINIGNKTTAEYFKGYGGTSAIEVVNNNEVTSPIRIDMTEAERADIKKYAFWNGENVVPVEITIKEYKQPNTDPKLYMAITINKEGDTVTTGRPETGKVPIIAQPSTISLSDLVKGVNSNNKDFLKYFLNSMLSSEQIGYKKTALENERIKYEGKNAASVLPTAAQNETSTITTNDNSNVLPTATDTNSNNNLGIVNQDAQQLFEDLQNAKTSAKDKARKCISQLYSVGHRLKE